MTKEDMKRLEKQKEELLESQKQLEKQQKKIMNIWEKDFLNFTGKKIIQNSQKN